jgi:CRP/FNR family cyclic AMP-dependent transcriptional regulator
MRVIADPKKIKSQTKSTQKRAFDAQAFLDSAGIARRIAEFPRKATIFAQGDPAQAVKYIQEGSVKLTVVNGLGKEAVVAVLGPGDFFGEGCLAAQPIRIGAATATAPTTLLVIDKKEMSRILHAEHEFSDRFISYMLTRNLRIEAGRSTV